MAPIPLPLGLESNRGKLRSDSATTLENLYPEMLKGERSGYALYLSPGLKRIADTERGPFRGAIDMPTGLLIASGSLLSILSPAGVLSPVGGIPGSGPVSMARDAVAVPTVFLVSGGAVYTFSGGSLRRYETDALPSPIDVHYIGGRFLFGIPDGRFFYTDAYSTTVRGDNFYTAAQDGDGLVGKAVRRREVWLFGQKSLEIFSITADDDDPFAPIGPSRSTGCLARATIAEVGDRLFWVDQDCNVRAAEGYDGAVVSTPFVNDLIDNADPSSLWSSAHVIGGSAFYDLSSSDWTLRYSLDTQKWTERTTTGLKGWTARGAVSWNRKTIMGDRSDGRIFQLDKATLDDDGALMVGRIVTRHIGGFPVPLVIYSLHLDIETGLGSYTEAPSAKLRLSYDGGKTWGHPKLAKLGRAGQKTRVIWRKLGPVERDGTVFEITLPAVAGLAVYSAVINGEAGTA